MELMNTRMFKWKKEQLSGLAKYMDIIILSDENIIYNKSLEFAKTIFIYTKLGAKLIIYFIDNILPKLIKPINLIISGSDYTFPNNTDKRMKSNAVDYNMLQQFKNLGKHKFINKIFVENLDENIENTLPIPLGINPRECPINIDYFLQFENIDSKKPLKFTNFNRKRTGKGQWRERGYVKNLCKKHWCNYYIENDNQLHTQYLQLMGKYTFTICVHGGGLDVNPKLWEALLIGVIPIIKENKPYTDIYKTFDFPVVIVKKWDIDTINEKNLLLWHKKYYEYFTNTIKRKELLQYLTLDFWVNYVSNFDS
jgi:hypothetical protein